MRNDSELSPLPPISEAVVLMAGSGSRLRANGFTLAKPLIPILGRPLISYTIDSLIHAGIKTVYAVVGFEGESLVEQLQPLIPRDLAVHFIKNPDWQKQNGVSLLTAADHVASPFLLTMSDHLLDESIVDLLLRNAVPDALSVAIDRKLDSIFDLHDAMKVHTREGRIVAIGKNLREYDSIDTGLFISPPEIFAYLERAKQHGDCSLADGVRLMAAAGKVRAIDIGEAWWQDVDTPQMLKHAEKMIEQSKLQVPAK
jgi:1L-myo-inositol 1-phosphate cytidylyltransferase